MRWGGEVKSLRSSEVKRSEVSAQQRVMQRRRAVTPATATAGCWAHMFTIHGWTILPHVHSMHGCIFGGIYGHNSQVSIR